MRLLASAVAGMTIAISAEAADVGALQGAGHISPSLGSRADATGIVTLVRGNGFFLQGASDGDDATSDGIFVFSSATPPVALGDRVRVEGRIVEFTPPGRPQQLSLTELVEPEVVILERGLDLPDPVLLGPGGRMPPTEIIDDDGLAEFQPATDAIDFFESIEGVRVVVEDALALDRVNDFGEVWTLPGSGRDATGFNGRDAIVMREGDQNPERILLDLGLVNTPPGLEAGAAVGTATGILDYAFGNYRLQVTHLDSGPRGGGPARTDPEALTVGSYNVENLDPVVEDRALVASDADVDDDVGDGKFAAFARQIVEAMAVPAIVALQEVQDNDGAERTPVVTADATLSTLTDAIEAAGGPSYDFLDLPPDRDADGGQPGANIRVAYLFDPDRARLVPASPRRIVDPDTADGDAFSRTRKPLLATFETDAGPITLINVHLSSRGGSDTAFGATQPPRVGAADARLAQSAVLAREVDALLEQDPESRVLVLGDFNAFYFDPELTLLEAGGRLVNLHWNLWEEARYTYVFEGQGQALDHVLVTAAARERSTLQILHLNAGRLSAASDHDPILVTLPPAGDIEDIPRSGLREPPDDLVGEALRTWLRENWYNGRHTMLGYNAARRAMYARIDVRDDGRVQGVYSGFSQPAGDVTFLDPINAEHTVPQSWFGSAEPMRSDIHHLFPTHKDVNSARGSKPFGEIADEEADRWYGVGTSGELQVEATIPATSVAQYAEGEPDEFEPPEAHKGDAARAIFYFYAMYPGRGPADGRDRRRRHRCLARLASRRSPRRPRAAAQRPHRGGATQPQPVRR